MGFYDEIAKDINWEYGNDVESYFKVKSGKLQLPHPKWLQYHFNKIDDVIEAVHSFRNGMLSYEPFDIEQVNKTYIEDPQEGIKFIKWLTMNYKEFSIDIETSNLLTDRKQNHLLMIGIGYEENASVIFMKHCFENLAFRHIFQLFVQNPNLIFILHNGVFDRSRMIILESIKLKIDDDTLLMHYCGINEHKGTHGLKHLAQLYLGFPDWEAPLDKWKREYCRKNKIKLQDFQYDYFDQHDLAYYCCIDVCATFRLKKIFKQLMRPSSVTIYRKLVEASTFYANMIARGMLLNEQYWYQLRDQLEKEKADLEKQLAEIMPGVSPTSPVQLGRWLRATYPYDNVEGTGKEIIEDLSVKHPDDKVFDLLLQYRKNVKYLKTYVYGLWERKDYQNVIHCEFKLFGTETGRLSSSNPNMQNIPRNGLIKRLFIARPGYTLIQLDYSQCELRVLAHISGDDILSQCYIDGRDLHGEMAQQMFGDKFDPHNKDQRMAAKIINFGIPYGRTPGGVAKQLKCSIEEAKMYLARWFAGAPKVKQYIEKCHEMAMADPQDIYYTIFGRARHYFITSENVHHVKNQAVNFPISSTANDLTIHSLCEIGHWLEKQKLDAYLVNTVHDSIIIEARPEDTRLIAEKCQKIMQEVPLKYLKDVKLPFKADAEIGTCYGDLSEPDWYEEEEDD